LKYFDRLKNKVVQRLFDQEIVATALLIVESDETDIFCFAPLYAKCRNKREIVKSYQKREVMYLFESYSIII